MEKSLIFTIPTGSNGQKAVYVGGLADRLKGVCFCYLLSSVLKRSFFIDWQEPFPLEEVLSPNKVNWIIDRKKINTKNTVVVNLIDKKFTEDIKYILKTDPKKFVDTLGNPENISILCNSFPGNVVSDLYSSLKTLEEPINCDDHFFEIFHTLFQYRFENKAEQRKSDFIYFKRKYKMIIGAQFRAGKTNKLWKDPYMDNPNNAKYLFKAIKNTAKKIGITEYGVFLTTDNPTVKLSATKIFKEKNIFYFNDEPVHFERSKSSGKNSDIDLHKQVLLEFYLLSQCDHIICGVGGFGVTAALSGSKQYTRYWECIGILGTFLVIKRNVSKKITKWCKNIRKLSGRIVISTIRIIHK